MIPASRFVLTLLAFAALPGVSLAGTGLIPFESEYARRAPAYVPGELLVKFRNGVTHAQAAAAVGRKGAAAKRVLTPDGLVQVELPPGISMDAAIDSLNALPDVEYATPNGYAHAFSVPNDSVIGKFDLAWNLRNVGAFAAWDVVTGDPKIVLAIIDTGIAYEDHPIPDYELANVQPGVTRYRQSPELPGPFLPGYDFVSNDDHPNDDSGHGTMVATIAAGQANNIAGSAGIAFGVTLLPIKVLEYSHGGRMSVIIQGIRYAADQGADIANLSLGFESPRQLLEDGLTKKEIRDFFRPLRDAVRYAQRRGVILVAAAGNFSYPQLSLPAGYPGVIAVGATRFDNRITQYSSWGEGIDFVAPGGDDGPDQNGDGIQDQLFELSMKPWRPSEHDDNRANPDSFNVFNFFGTSGAAPHVSGAVALLMSLGVKKQGAIERILRETALNQFGGPCLPDTTYGFGLIQIDKAVRLAASRRHHKHDHDHGGKDRDGARIVSENPSRAGASLALTTTQDGMVSVQLFDVTGRLVRTLEEGRYPAGERVVRWDGKDDRGRMVGTGVYFIRAVTPDGVQKRRIAVLR